MISTRIPAILVAAAALALPAGALAQSAGDNQYTDPLAGTHSTPKHHSSSGSSSGQSSSPSTSSTSRATATTDPQASTTVSQSASSSKQLPRTGFELLLPVELGLAMLLAGVTLQRVVVLRDRR